MNISEILSFFLHLDKYLQIIIEKFGFFSYAVLFLIIFMETGFVVTPFLPGDSIIFAAGAFSAVGTFDVFSLFLILFIAAVLGDTVNYWIGHRIGPKIFERDSKFIKKEHLEKTKTFYKKHGGITIVLARFIPIVRTFAPFVAGIGVMDYKKFLSYNVAGGFLWVGLFLLLGYFFGNIPFVKENFELAIIVVVLVSVVPVVVEILKTKRKRE